VTSNPVRIYRLTAFDLVATVLVSVMWLSAAHAQAIVSQQQLVSATRVDKGTWQFTYQVAIQNGPLALNAVTIAAADTSLNGSVHPNSVVLGDLAANTTVTTNVTFQATSTQPGANGDYHDSFWSSYLGSLLFEVIPGPGPIAQATISSAEGGTITVTGAGNPLNGTQVVIPPGALGDSTDTITIGYSNVLPGALDSNATAAGVVPVTKVVTLTRLGTTPFNQAVAVTVPYSTTVLGTLDYPVVLYWDAGLGQYQPIQIISVDQSGGRVTFDTKHFTSFAGIGLPGLLSMLQGKSPFVSQLLSLNTSFVPLNDGFEIQNFTTGQTGITSNGVCYGLTSFAAWYFAAKPGPKGLYQQYQAASDSGATHVQEEDAVARELVAETFVDTSADNQATTSNASGSLLSMTELVLALAVTHSPQLVTLGSTAGSHSVLAYDWSAVAGSFDIYDPNFPGTIVPPLIWSYRQGFTPYPYPQLTFTSFGYDAWSSHYDKVVLAELFGSSPNAQTGPPGDQFGQGWRFNLLSITSPLGASGTVYPGGPAAPKLTVDPIAGTPLSFSWNCGNCADKPYYLHVLQKNSPIGIRLPIAPGGPPVTVTTAPFGASSAELIAFVSSSQAVAVAGGDQIDISSGYAAYQRVELQGTPMPTVTVEGSVDVFPGTTQLPPGSTNPVTISCGVDDPVKSFSLSGSISSTASCTNSDGSSDVGTISLNYSSTYSESSAGNVETIRMQVGAAGTALKSNPNIGLASASFATVYASYVFSTTSSSTWSMKYQGSITGLDYTGTGPLGINGGNLVWYGSNDYYFGFSSNGTYMKVMLPWTLISSVGPLGNVSEAYTPAIFCNSSASLQCLKPAIGPQTLNDCVNFVIPAGGPWTFNTDPQFILNTPNANLSADITVTISNSPCP
jgi:hypothetical protein